VPLLKNIAEHRPTRPRSALSFPTLKIGIND